MLSRLIFTFTLILTLSISYAQDYQVFFNDGIVFIKGKSIEIKDTTINGRLLYYPEGWSISSGKDSIAVAYPPKWITMQGKDGHLVAFPPTWTANEGPDGRIVAYPYEEIVVKKRIKIDTCNNADTSKCYYTVEYKLNKYKVYYQEGKDGRGILYTKDMFLALSPDGRLVNIPKGWEISQNDKGRLSAYPKNWIAYSTGDKDFALPKNWEIDYQKDAPEIIKGKDFVKFIYVPVQTIEIAKTIYENEKTNGLDYVLYLLFNE